VNKYLTTTTSVSERIMYSNLQQSEEARLEEMRKYLEKLEKHIEGTTSKIQQ